MNTERTTWIQLHTLAQRARMAATARQQLDIQLSPQESLVLADVLETALRMMSTVMGRPELDLGDPSVDELAYLAMQGGAFDWLADEPDLYSDADLKERFEWPTD